MSNSSVSRRLFLAGTAISVSGVAGLAPAFAQGVDFSGKTLDFVNFGAPGSPPDVWYRTLIPFLEKHLPGNPKINTINKPGASSMIAANYTAQAISNDGTAFGSMNAVAMNKAAMGNDSARFDLKTLEIVGAQKLTRLVVVKKAGLTSLDDILAMDGELVLGMESDATPYFDSFFKLIGVQSKIISSYERFPDTLQAFRSGEVDAMPMSVIEWLTFGPDLSNDGAFAAFQYGFGDGTSVTASGAVDIPTGHAVVEKVNAAGVGTPEWDVMSVQALGQTVSNQIWAPEGTPVDHVETLAQGFVAATSDPEFIEQHTKQYGLAPEWTDRASARVVIDSVLAVYGK